MTPAGWVLILGAAVGTLGWIGMVKHRAKGYGYVLYSLGVFTLGTIAMLNAPTIGSICIGGVCYLFSFLTVVGAAVAQHQERKPNGQQSVHQGQVHGSHAEEDRHGA